MSGPKQHAPEPEILTQLGTAQLITLGSTASPASKASSVLRNGSDISGINVVVRLGGDNYLTSLLSGSVASALTQKLRSLPGEERVSFTASWMKAVKSAIYDEYQHATAVNPTLTSFDYAIPSFDIVKPEAAQNEFRPAPIAPGPAKSYVASKIDMILDTNLIKPSKPSIPQLPDLISGKGTSKSPYVLDLTARSTSTDNIGPMQFVMPLEFDLGLDKSVFFKFILTASQVKQVKDGKPNAPFITELKSLANQAFEVSCAAQNVPYDGDVYNKAEDALRQLGGKLVSFSTLVKDEKMKAYFAR